MRRQNEKCHFCGRRCVFCRISILEVERARLLPESCAKPQKPPTDLRKFAHF